MSKRKVGNSNYEDNEEEDEWEREASVSSSTKSSSRHSKQPNLFAIQANILDDQYETLTKTEQELEAKLLDLQSTLNSIQADNKELEARNKTTQSKFLNKLLETVSSLDLYNSETADIKPLPKKEHIAYTQLDETLTEEIQSTINLWKADISESKFEKDLANSAKSLSNAYIKNELNIIDLTAQVEGYEARIQSLERDRNKLNSLPQIISMLRLDYETHKKEFHTSIADSEKLVKTIIIPQLTKLSRARITNQLKNEYCLQSTNKLSELEIALKGLYKIALKQCACQQLILSTEQVDHLKTRHGRIKALKYVEKFLIKAVALQLELRNQQEKGKEDANKIENTSDEHLELIKRTLNSYYGDEDQKSTIEKVKALKERKIELKAKWQKDFNSCLDGARELDALQDRLKKSLVAHSDPTDNILVMAPKHYTNLQSELEFRTTELNESVSVLEKRTKDENSLGLFQQLRTLFSLFFTDPDTFTELHKQYL